MNPLCFASTNQNKFSEIKSILQQYNLGVTFRKLDTKEIQSDSLEEIALEKCRYAFSKIKSAVIVEDDGLFIDKLNGFPGQYSAFVFKTIGIKGTLELLRTSEDRSACFTSIITFCNGQKPHLFSGKTRGRIKEDETEGGWGFDPIFIPTNSDLSFGQLHLLKRKQDYSHRSKALSKFAKWYRQLNQHDEI
jgi:XTP/dITP diphosphohydrolase